MLKIISARQVGENKFKRSVKIKFETYEIVAGILEFIAIAYIVTRSLL